MTWFLSHRPLALVSWSLATTLPINSKSIGLNLRHSGEVLTIVCVFSTFPMELVSTYTCCFATDPYNWLGIPSQVHTIRMFELQAIFSIFRSINVTLVKVRKFDSGIARSKNLIFANIQSLRRRKRGIYKHLNPQ